MALSGSFTGTTNNQNIQPKITWSATQNKTENYSTVTATLTYSRTNSGYTTSGKWNGSITINGSTKSVSTTSQIYISQDSNTVAMSSTVKVPHNSDGTKSVKISCTGSIPVASLSSTTCSSTITLDSIPRKATVTSASDFNDEQNPTIEFTNNGGFTINARLEFGNNNSANIQRLNISNTGKYTFNLTDAERDLLREKCTGNSMTVRMVIGTKIDSDSENYWSWLDKTMTIVNANPTFADNDVDYADTNGTVTGITLNPHYIVQNKSTLQVTYGQAIAYKGASITGYSFTLNGVTKTSTSAGGTVDFGTVDSAQNLTLTATATDSRGNKATVPVTVTMLEYSPPNASVTLARVNNYEDTSKLTVDGFISSVNNLNTMTIKYRYKQSGGTYGYLTEISDNVEETVICDKNHAFIFEIQITDLFGGSFVKEYVLDKGKFPLFIDTKKNAVGINEFPSDGEALRVNDGIGNFEDGLKLQGSQVADFIVEQGISGVWTYRKWYSGIAECWGFWHEEGIAIGTPSRGGYMSAVMTKTLPFVFKGSGIVSMGHVSNSMWLGSTWVSSDSDTLNYTISRITSATSEQCDIRIFIIGKWK